VPRKPPKGDSLDLAAHVEGMVIEANAHAIANHRSEARKFREIEAEMAGRALRHEEVERARLAVLREDGRLAQVEELVAQLMTGEPATPHPPRRGNDAVLTLMQEQQRIWTARELHDELDRRGWINPDAAHPLRGTEAAINRLHRSGKVEKLGRGRYRAKP
jgi:hypothetical protein